MPKYLLRALLLSASLSCLTLAGCGGGGGGGPRTPSTPTNAGGSGSSGGSGSPANAGGAGSSGGSVNTGSSGSSSGSGGSSSSGGSENSGPAAPELPAIARVVSDEFALSPLFTDHAVLQRDQPLRVWGRAAPGERVTVELAGRSALATTANDGRWMANLGAFGASGPLTLTAKAASGPMVARGDILMGDVWLCSGQSNMEMSFEWNVRNKGAEVAAANYPNIRLLELPHNANWSPQSSFNAAWQPCSSGAVRPFSAAAYFFGREIHQRTGVAVGLIDAAWSATPAQSWISARGLANLGEFRGPLAQNPETAFLTTLNRWWRDNDAGTRINWSRTSYDDSAWKTAQLPGSWSAAGVTEPVGVIWLRLQVNVPASLAGRDLKWNAGAIGGTDTAFWNGNFVGQNPERDKERHYIVPGNLVKAGPNVVALRIAGNGGGGVNGEMSLRPVDGNEAPIALSGVWKYRVSLAPDRAASLPQAGSFGVPASNLPTIAYNGQIAPLQPLGLKGAIWYQGEANVAGANSYDRLLSALIDDWREGFGQPMMPFYIAQLASYGAPDENPTDAGWPNLQWAQNRVAARVPNTGLAVLNDIGEVAQIHPANKQDVGKRLALLALRDVYGQNVTASGPKLQRYAVQGSEIRLTFANATGGLRLEGDAGHVFAMSDVKGEFSWATPRIENNEIVLSAPNISSPRDARFAWSGTPRATLYNGADLPASLFATDK